MQIAERMRSLRFGIAAAICLGMAGCSADTGRSDDACVSSPILGGLPSPELVGLSREEQRAIVAVVVGSVTGESAPSLCSGIVIGRGLVLTARHCVATARDEGVSLAVFVGSSWAPSSAGRAVDRIWLHPVLDVALLEASWLLDEGMVSSIPLELAELGEAWVGSPVELAGFGESNEGMLGGLAFAVENIARLESDHIVVDGRGASGACLGDSGGPLFGVTAGGVRVLGILDQGHASCVGEDYYTRLDRLATWEPLLAQWARPGCSG